jgi:hypothetical protein
MSGRMVLRRSHHGGRRHRKSMHGRGIFDFLKKAHDFLRRHKIISTVGSALSGLHPAIGHITTGARALGYGRRRHRHKMHRGGALKLAGAGLGLAGGMRHRRRMR